MFKGNSLTALILELVLYRNALWECSGANLGPLSTATLQQSCLVPRRLSLSLSLDKHLHAKEDGKEKKGEMALRVSSSSFPWSTALRYQSLAFRARLYAKYEAPEEKAGNRP